MLILNIVHSSIELLISYNPLNSMSKRLAKNVQSSSSRNIKSKVIRSNYQDFTPFSHWKSRISPFKEALQVVPATTVDRLTYIYDFEHEDFNVWNPNGYCYPTKFPIKKLEKVFFQ